MSSLVIANSAIIDAATVTASGAAASLPVTNLQNEQPEKIYRSDDTAPYIEIDLGSAQAINLISVLYHTLTSAGTWHIRAATTQGNLTASPGYDSGVVDIWDAGWPTDQSPLHGLKWLTSSQTYRWWRIDFSDAGNADGYIDIGRLYIDNAWQLPDGQNISYGWQVEFIDPSTHARSKGARLYTEAQTAWRALKCSMDFLDEDEMYDNLYELQRRRGRSKDALVIRDPAATTHLIRQMIYGKFTQLSPIINDRRNIFRSRVHIEEML